MSLMAFHAVNKKISLHIGDAKYIGAFKLTRSKTIEDRLPEVDFISPLDKIPTENEYKFWFGACRNKYEKNPYLLVRINIDPLDVMYIGSANNITQFKGSDYLIGTWRSLSGVMTDEHDFYGILTGILRESGFDI